MGILNTWQFNLVLYLFFVVLFFQFYKLAVKNVKRDGAATILLQIIAGLSILLLTPLFPFRLPSDIKFYFLLGGASIFYALNDRFQTTARKHLEVSVFSVINQLTNIFLIVFGITLFREPVLTSKLLGAAFILSGNIILSFKGNKFSLNKYSFVAVIATLFFSIAISIDIGISKQFNLPFYIALTLLIPAILISITEKLSFKYVAEEFKFGNKKYFLVTGITWGLAILFSLRSFALGKVTLIVPLQATSILLNVIIAYLFLKERDNLAKKIIAATLVIVGICSTVLA